MNIAELPTDLDLDIPRIGLTFRPRPYQEEAEISVFRAWTEFRKVLVVQATGTGKTVLFSSICAKVVDSGGRALVLAHLGELLDQAGAKLETYGLSVNLEKADCYASPYAQVVLASWQTLARESRLTGFKPDHFSHIIVDECHRVMSPGYQKILGHFADANVLGVTATADRGDKKSLGDFFEIKAFEYGLREACQDGWLVRPIAKTLPIKVDLANVKVKRSSDGADIDQTEVAHRIEPFLGEIAAAMWKEAPTRKHMVFLPSVDCSEKFCEAAKLVGFNPVSVSGNDPDRYVKTDAFNRGEFNMLCNCALYLEGYDHDQISCVTVLRPTKVRSLLAQAVGRGTRPLSHVAALLGSCDTAEQRRALIANSAKPNLLILDPLWLTEKLDLAKPADLVARSSDVAKRMTGEGDLLSEEEVAQRDLMESLKKELARHSRKKSKIIDPLNFASAIGDESLATYEPATAWEAAPVTEPQKQKLTQMGIDAGQIKYRGHAHKILGVLFNRSRQKLAVPRQIEFFKKLGIDAADMTASEAAKRQKDQIEQWRKRAKKTYGKEYQRHL